MCVQKHMHRHTHTDTYEMQKCIEPVLVGAVRGDMNGCDIQTFYFFFFFLFGTGKTEHSHFTLFMTFNNQNK